jgi:glycosyltransferase involved in cell wall biosynthesis
MGLSEGRVVVLPPVPPPPAPPAPAGALRALLGVGPEQLLVGTHGAVDLSKGSDVFVEAAARSGRPEAIWVLMGDGPLLGELRERAGEGGRLRFTGWREDAASLLGDLDLYVLPSRTEGLPLALLEAMAAGRPAVATAVGGVPEVLGPAGGRLVAPEDPEALAAVVDALLEDPVERDLLGRALARAATAYHGEAVVRDHRRLYRALAGEEEP